MKAILTSLKVLDLFSGIGGFSLGLERAGMTTVAFCEQEPYCRSVLKQHWPDVPVFPDIRELTSDQLPVQPDLICGGYPCQPFSVAGKQRGGEGEGYCTAHWQAEPGLDRVADGIPDRVDRIKALGNAVVPQILELLGRMIMKVHP